MSALSLSRITSTCTVAKGYALGVDRTLSKIGGGLLQSGTLDVVGINDLSGLSQVITSLTPHQALVLGVPRDGRRTAPLATRARIENGQAPAGAIARTLENIGWAAGSGIGFLDHDGDLPPTQLLEIATKSVPEFADVEILAVPSSSFGISTQSGEFLRAQAGWHLYFGCQQASDVGLLKKVLQQALPSRVDRSKSGARLTRYDFDLSVFSPERLDFAGQTVLGQGLVKIAPQPFILQSGGLLKLSHGGNLFAAAPAVAVAVGAPETASVPVVAVPAPTPAPARVEELKQSEEESEKIEAKKWLESEHRGNLVSIFARLNRQILGKLTDNEFKQVQELLRFIPSATGAIEYQNWIAVGQVLRNAFSFELGQKLFVWWSQLSPNSDSEKDLIRKFNSLRKAKGGQGFGLGKLYSLAEKNGYKGLQGAQAGRDLPPVRAGVSVQQGMAQVSEFFDDLPVELDAGARLLLWASTGVGKSHGTISYLKKCAAAGKTVGVTGFPNKLAVENYKKMLDEAGVRCIIHYGRQETDPDSAEQWLDQSCFPGKKGVIAQCRTAGQSLGEGHCHSNCRIGENVQAAKKHEDLPHPELPASCWLGHHNETKKAAKGGMVVLFTSDIPPDFWPKLDLVVRDEDGGWDRDHAVSAGTIAESIAGEQSALTVYKSAPFADAEIVKKRETIIWLLKGWLDWAIGASAIKPSMGNLTSADLGLSTEAMDVLRGHIPAKWTQNLIKNYESAWVGDGEIRWLEPVLPAQTPVITLSATPSPETQKLCENNTTRVLVTRNVRVEVDDSKNLGMSQPQSAFKTAQIGKKLRCEATVYTQRAGVSAHKDMAPGDEVSTAASAISHNRWAGQSIGSIGCFNPPPEALKKMWDIHAHKMARLGVQLSPWSGRMIGAKWGFVPDNHQVTDWLIQIEAAMQAQILGRSGRGLDGDASVTHKIVGCRPGVAEVLRSEHGLEIELADIMATQGARQKVMRVAGDLLQAGKEVTRAAVEAAGDVGHEAYQWLANESPLRLRLAEALKNKGVAARLKQELARAAQKLGSDLLDSLRVWAHALADGSGYLEGAEPEELERIDQLSGLSICLPEPPG